MQEVVIMSAARTPIGAFQGALASVAAPALGAIAIKAAIERGGVAPSAVEQVYMGCVLPAGQGQAPARQASLAAGCPTSTGAITLNKVCGSGMRAVMSAANDLRCGDFQLAVAGGMESMSQAPYLLPGARTGYRLGHGQLVDSMIHDGLWDPYGDKHMGNCAETCATHFELSREAQDAYAEESYRRAQAAVDDGRLDAEIVAVEVPQRRGAALSVARDEEPGRANFEKMKTLRPAFQRAGGTVTAANASKINDGAAALLLSTAEHAASLGLAPRARLVSQATFAHDPEWFTTAPISAIHRAVERAGLSLDAIDLYEINEAFAAVAMVSMTELEISHDRLNVHGGAVALGHPLGASGARILVTLLHAMEARNVQRGCAAICLGGGEATAMVIEREVTA